MQGISRRAVTKAAAWSVPLLAVAVAAPLAAASTSDPLNVTVAAMCTAGSTGPASRGFLISVGFPGQNLPAGSVFRLDAGVALDPTYIAPSSAGVVTVAQGGNANQLLITTSVDFTPLGQLFLGLKSAALRQDDPANYTLTSLTPDSGPSDNAATFSAALLGGTDATICL